jgi:NAD dependent epimerase/dehydratase
MKKLRLDLPISPPSILTGRNLLVTGGDGFIGSHVVEACLAAGARVTAMAMYNSFDQAGWLDEVVAPDDGRLSVIRGDIRDDGFVRRAVADCDTVIHLAALVGIPYSYAAPRAYVDTNVMGTLNVLEAARAAGRIRIIHTSTSEVYGTALRTPIDESHPLQGQSPYSASKIGADMLAESFARSFDMDVMTLRPFNTYGPRQSERAIIPTVIRQALDPECREIRIGDLTPLRDMTFVIDTAAAFVLAAAKSGFERGAAYNLGTGKSISIRDITTSICRLVGTNKPIVEDKIRLRPPNSEVRELLSAPDRFAASTGWRAQTEIDEGLHNTIAWWRGRVAGGKVRQSAAYAT